MKTSLTKRTFLSELRVLWAFTKREFVIYLRYPLDIVFDLLMEPFYIIDWMLIGLFYVGGTTSQNLLSITGTGDFISYLFLGGVLMSFGRGAVWTVASSLRREMMQGTLESCWITPISRFTILTGRVFMNFFWMIVFNLFTGVGIYLIFNPSWHLDWFALLLIFVLTMLSNYAFGLLMGGIVFVFKEVWSFRDIFVSVLWILSGATFPVEMLPTWAQSLSRLVPYYYSLRDFRAVVLSGAALPELTGDLTFLLLFAVVSLLTSYILFKRLERVALRAGTLGVY